MSKTFPVSRLRIGIRFSRGYTDGPSPYAPVTVIPNFNSMAIGMRYMERFLRMIIFLENTG